MGHHVKDELDISLPAKTQSRGNPPRHASRIAQSHLDPITNAGCLAMKRLHIVLQKYAWATSAYRALRGGTVLTETMHPVSTIPKHLPFRKTSRDLEPSLHLLKSSNVVNFLGSHIQTEDRISLQYFEVPKTSGKHRAILDCRQTNEHANTPPRLHLPEQHVIFAIINFWPKPNFGTMDYCNWFYQIPLPQPMWKYFTIRLDHHVTFEMRVWPQGFNWSPYVAQTVAWCIVLESQHVTWEPYTVDEGTPLFALARNLSGELIAIVTIWYDNILVCANSDQNRDFIMESIQNSNTLHQAKVKESNCTSHEVVFNGVHYLSGGYWKHSKPEKWPELPSPIALTARKIAIILGYTTWDWYITGNAEEHTFALTSLASWLGTTMSDKVNNWDNPMILPGNLVEHWKTITNNFISIKTRNAPKRRRIPTKVQVKTTIFCASDATPTWGGWVMMEKPDKITLSKQWKFQHGLQDASFDPLDTNSVPINRREIEAAIACVAHIAETQQNAKIIIAIDNTTAIHALKKGFYRYHEQTNSAIGKLLETLENKQLVLIPKYVKSEMQPADYLTRPGAKSAPTAKEVQAALVTVSVKNELERLMDILPQESD
jgi:hypothetical protein